jgi:hypothetical protein
LPAYEAVRAAWTRLSGDAHVGMSNAFEIVAAAENSDEGRRALSEILTEGSRVTIESDALSYLLIARDIPLPSGVEDNRADAFFRTRLYTGMRVSKTHQIPNPKEFLYFNLRVAMITGTLDDVAAVRAHMRGSGYEPVTARRGSVEKAIGIVMVNEFRDTTFGPYNEVILIAMAVPTNSSASLKSVDYVNGFSLEAPIEQGATCFPFKLWLDQLGPIDGGNDYLGTNKELGSFRFEDGADGNRIFRGWDRELKPIVSGRVPRGKGGPSTRGGANGPNVAAATMLVASRPDADVEKPACRWAFAVEWRSPLVQEVTPNQVALSFGDAEWAARFAGFGFTPALAFYAASGVGQIFQNVGDCAYNPAGISAKVYA